MDLEAGVERIDAALRLGVVSGRVEIEHCAIIGQGLETVRDTFWNHQSQGHIAAQVNSMPLKKGRRAFAKIERDIKDAPAQTGDDFCLRRGSCLEMHAAYGSGQPGQSTINLFDAPRS